MCWLCAPIPLCMDSLKVKRFLEQMLKHYSILFKSCIQRNDCTNVSLNHLFLGCHPQLSKLPCSCGQIQGKDQLKHHIQFSFLPLCIFLLINFSPFMMIFKSRTFNSVFEENSAQYQFGMLKQRLLISGNTWSSCFK